MNQDIYSFNNKIYSNNNNLLLGIINDLQQINNITHDNLVIKRIGDIINKMNFIINDNKKNTELIINHISILQNQMNKKFDELKFNNINQINNQELKYDDGRYIGQVVNGNLMEKEFIIIIMVIDMKVILEIIKEKEKEYVIFIMVIDMKVIGEMIILKEKEFII